MIIKYPAYEELNHHLNKFVEAFFSSSNYDTFSVRYDYVEGYIAKVEFASIRSSFFAKGQTANDATLKVLRAVKAFCQQENVRITSTADIIEFEYET